MRKRGFGKRVIALALSATLVFGNHFVIPGEMCQVEAAETTFQVSGGVEGTDYRFDGNQLIILTNKSMTISGNTRGKYIYIQKDANLTLSNLTIDTRSVRIGEPGIGMADDSAGTVVLTIEGTNSIDGWKTGIQKNGESGSLTFNGSGTLYVRSCNNAAAIGSDCEKNTGNITFNGGTIKATSLDLGAGIGSGFKGTAKNIRINGGDIFGCAANGGGAGIGGGSLGNADGIYITGGSVEGSSWERKNTGTTMELGAAIGGGALGTGKNIHISGGTVKVNFQVAVNWETHKAGAAIGGGAGGAGTDIEISGGTINVTALEGDSRVTSFNGGAAIGGGNGANGENVLISGGVINVISGVHAAAIGGGYQGVGKNIRITGGKIKATAFGTCNTNDYGGAAIGNGGCNSSDLERLYNYSSSVSIEGGTIYAKGSKGAAAIGGRYQNTSTVYISGGSINGIAGVPVDGNNPEIIGSGAKTEKSKVAYSESQPDKKVALTISNGYQSGEKVVPVFINAQNQPYSSYGTKDLYADETGSLYFYLVDGVKVDESQRNTVCKHTGQTEKRNEKAATCKEKGYTGDVYCVDCGEIITPGQEVPVISHIWQTIIDKEATQEATGLKHEECKNCKEKRNEEIIPVIKVEHVHVGKKIEAVPATCLKEGTSEHFICECGKLFRDAACTTEITSGDTVIQKQNHLLGDWKKDEKNHWKQCSRQNCTWKEQVEGHTFTMIVDEPATEEKEGKQHEECSICHYKKDPVAIPIIKKDHVHVSEKVEAIPATCEKDGVVEYYKCECGKLFRDAACKEEITQNQIVEKALGHKFKVEWEQDETKHFICCERKDCEKKEREEDHSWIMIVDQPATVEEEGLQHEECIICKYAKEGEKTPKLEENHEHKAITIQEIPATCEKNGTIEYYYCECGKFFDTAECANEITLDRIFVEATGHEYGEWSVAIEPTSTETGLEVRVCNKCGKEEQRILEATGEIEEEKPTEEEPKEENPTEEKPDDNPSTQEPSTGDKTPVEVPTEPEKVIVLKKNTVKTDRKNQCKVKVTKPGSVKNGKVTGASVEYLKPSKTTSKVVIPESVRINGVTYKVTSVSSGAFKNNRKMKEVSIGKNITKIGSGAFYGCKNLKKIKITSSQLKKIDKNALKGISSKAKILLPKKQYTKYKKMLTSKTGYKKTMKIQKY